jgi:Cys-rich protein (TIGR01571 family)
MVTPAVRMSKQIMSNEFCNCCHCSFCCMACCFPMCMFGNTYSQSEQGPCLLGCLCYLCLCGVSRSSIQRTLGVADDGCVIGCCLHWFCPLCALVQEARAVQAWFIEGKPPASAVPAPLSMTTTTTTTTMPQGSPAPHGSPAAPTTA